MGGWVGGLKKIGDVYWCRFRHRGQEIHRSTGATSLGAAQHWLLEFRGTLRKMKAGQGPAPTVALLLAEWQLAHKGIHPQDYLDRVERDFRIYVLPAFGNWPADQVTTAAMARLMREYLAGMNLLTGRKHTARGANTMHRHVRSVWKWGVQENLLREMPWKIKEQKVQRKPKPTLPADLVDAFLAMVDRARNPHIGISVRAQLFLGLRESESLSLRYEWFTPDFTSYIPGRLREGVFHSKGGEAVAIPVPLDFQEMIRSTVGDRPAPLTGYVIPAKDGEPHRGQFTYLHVSLAGKAVGVQGLTPHRLRGTCATLLARAGVDIFVIQALLRHKDIQTTTGYVETDFQAVRVAQERLFSGGTKSGTTTLKATLQRRVKIRLGIRV